MTENSKSTAKLNEANTNLAVLDQQLTDYKAYLKELQDKPVSYTHLDVYKRQERS